jgi:hypothetical protein
LVVKNDSGIKMTAESPQRRETAVQNDSTALVNRAIGLALAGATPGARAGAVTSRHCSVWSPAQHIFEGKIFPNRFGSFLSAKLL